MIELQPFTKSDCDSLIAEIPDARFLLQWAGPKYTFPLDMPQLLNTLQNSTGAEPVFQLFKVLKTGTSLTIGHIQLMDINYHDASCVLGRVLIYKKYRGNGYGKAMVREAVNFAFNTLQLDIIKLGVFDFNSSAVNTYKSIGFVEFQFKKGIRKFQDERWNVVKMKLSKADWTQQKN